MNDALMSTAASLVADEVAGATSTYDAAVSRLVGLQENLTQGQAEVDTALLELQVWQKVAAAVASAGPWNS